MIRRLIPCFFLAGVLAFGQVAYVTTGDGMLGLFDTTTNASIPPYNIPAIGRVARGIAVSPDGKRVYGVSQAFQGGMVTIIATATQTLVGTVGVDSNPESLA